MVELIERSSLRDWGCIVKGLFDMGKKARLLRTFPAFEYLGKSMVLFPVLTDWVGFVVEFDFGVEGSWELDEDVEGLGQVV